MELRSLTPKRSPSGHRWRTRPLKNSPHLQQGDRLRGRLVADRLGREADEAHVAGHLFGQRGSNQPHPRPCLDEAAITAALDEQRASSTSPAGRSQLAQGGSRSGASAFVQMEQPRMLRVEHERIAPERRKMMPSPERGRGLHPWRLPSFGGRWFLSCVAAGVDPHGFEGLAVRPVNRHCASTRVVAAAAT